MAATAMCHMELLWTIDVRSHAASPGIVSLLRVAFVPTAVLAWRRSRLGGPRSPNEVALEARQADPAYLGGCAVLQTYS
jgi:hypothetical protein